MSYQTSQSEVGSLHTAGVEAGEAAVGLNTMLSNLLDRLSPLKVEFLGIAGLKYQQIEEEVGAQMVVLNNALTQIGDDLGLSETIYEAGDEEMNEFLTAAGADDSDIQMFLNPA